MPEPSNEVPAKSASAGVRRLFYECLRSPLKPAFRRAPEASVKTARWMRRHLPGSFWVPFCGKKVQNTRDIVAAFSVLLMATDARSTSRDRLRAMPCQKEENERSEVKSTKTIRMSLSREQPPARVERAQQEQDYAASRSGHAGCRLFFLRCKRECGGCTSCTLPLAANDPGPMPCPSDPAEETAPAADQIEKASNPPSTTASAPVTNDEASLTR